MCVNTYAMDSGFIAKTTMRKLQLAAERGVATFLYIDHLCYWIDQGMKKQNKSAGVTIIKLNKKSNLIKNIFNFKMWKSFNRNHQKYLLTDNSLFIGSSNICSEYSGIKYGSEQFRDLNMKIDNADTTQIQNFFLRIHKKRSVLEKDELREALGKYFSENPVDEIEGNKEIQFLTEEYKNKSNIQKKLLELFSQAKESIILIQPYFQNIETINSLLIQAKKRNVKVEIITSKNRDQICYRHIINSHLFDDLIDNGIIVYEDKFKFLHMKAYIIDNKYLSLGIYLNIYIYNV